MPFAVTTIRILPNEKDGLPFETRTVGLFDTRLEAQDVLEQDLGDLAEGGWYKYAVVEEVGHGLYPPPDLEWTWYLRCPGDWVVQPEEPTELRRIISRYHLVPKFHSIG